MMAGTGTGKPATGAARLLYSDALHSIFAYLEVNDLDHSYREINSAARTCQRWLAAVTTMRHHRLHATGQAEQEETEGRSAPPSSFATAATAAAAATFRPSPLDGEVDPFSRVPPSSSDRVLAIVTSRLHRLVGGIRYSEVRSFDQLIREWRQIQFADRMSHVHTLELQILIDLDTNMQRDESATPSNKAKNAEVKLADATSIQACVFPPSLRSLRIQFLVKGDFLGYKELDETSSVKLQYPVDVGQKCNDPQRRQRIHDTLSTSMESVASHVTHSCSQMNRLELEFRYLDDESLMQANLPASAILPWSNRMTTLTTALPMLRRLTLVRPTLQCVEQVRPILFQLHRVDGVNKEKLLHRLLKKDQDQLLQANENSSTNTNMKIAALPPSPIQLRHYSLLSGSTVEILLLTRFFTQLRHLELVHLLCNPGSALASLPNLISFTCWGYYPHDDDEEENEHEDGEHYSQPSRGVTLLTSLSEYAQQLQYIKLSYCDLQDANLMLFLPQMNQLREFALRASDRLSTLVCFTCAPTSLVRVDLEYLPLASRAELDHLKHIPKVNCKNCDAKWPSSSSPMALELSDHSSAVATFPSPKPGCTFKKTEPTQTLPNPTPGLWTFEMTQPLPTTSQTEPQSESSFPASTSSIAGWTYEVTQPRPTPGPTFTALQPRPTPTPSPSYSMSSSGGIRLEPQPTLSTTRSFTTGMVNKKKY